MQRNTKADSTPRDDSDIPEGFVQIINAEGDKCIVPRYLLPATHKAFDAHRKRRELKIDQKEGGVSLFFSKLLCGWG